MGFWVDGKGVPSRFIEVGNGMFVEIVDKLGVGVENLAWLLKKGRLVLGKSMQGSRKNLAWFGNDGNCARSVAKSGTLGDLIYARMVRKLGSERE